MESIAIVYHEGVSAYDFGRGHPFRGDRFSRFIRLVKEWGILSLPNIYLTEPKAASDSELLSIHTHKYIKEVEQRAKFYTPITIDTPLTPNIVEAARLIVGTSLTAGDLVGQNRVKIAEGVGGGLHHAGKSYGGGFCVFNDVAICAKSLIDRHGMEKVLIFDSDVHAGNGTMDIFYDEPKILFVSVHQDPNTIYPGVGFIDQIGTGQGEGYTVNVPLPPKADDACMKLVLEQIFKPIVKEFKPQVIIRNGGSDPHFSDGLGSLNLSFQGLWEIGKAVKDAAEGISSGIIDLCCSGYNPATIAEGWLAILSGVIGIPFEIEETSPRLKTPLKTLSKTQKVLDELKVRLKDFWDFCR